MPSIICSHCQYLGQGVDMKARFVATLKHEAGCEDLLANEGFHTTEV